MTEPTTQTVSETAFKSDFLRLMKARGYIHQITHPVELDEAAASGVVTGYIGFDATAPSLHVGHLIQIMLLRRLQQAGHKPIVLMGGGTTKVGDPSFKDTQRPLLTEEKIAENIAGIKGVFEKFLTFGDGPTDLPRVHLHADAGDRFPGAEPPLWLRPADGRIGPVGQHHQRRRTDPQGGS